MYYYLGNKTGYRNGFPFRTERRFNTKANIMEFLEKELKEAQADEESLLILWSRSIAVSPKRISEGKCLPVAGLKMSDIRLTKTDFYGERLTTLMQPILEKEKRQDEQQMKEYEEEFKGTFDCLSCIHSGKTDTLKLGKCPKCRGRVVTF